MLFGEEVFWYWVLVMSIKIVCYFVDWFYDVCFVMIVWLVGVCFLEIFGLEVGCIECYFFVMGDEWFVYFMGCIFKILCGYYGDVYCWIVFELVVCVVVVMEKLIDGLWCWL